MGLLDTLREVPKLSAKTLLLIRSPRLFVRRIILTQRTGASAFAFTAGCLATGVVIVKLYVLVLGPVDRFMSALGAPIPQSQDDKEPSNLRVEVLEMGYAGLQVGWIL